MSEIALLSFGCAVSFIVAAAVFVYAQDGYIFSDREKSLVRNAADRDHEEKKRRAA